MVPIETNDFPMEIRQTNFINSNLQPTPTARTQTDKAVKATTGTISEKTHHTTTTIAGGMQEGRQAGNENQNQNTKKTKVNEQT